MNGKQSGKEGEDGRVKRGVKWLAREGDSVYITRVGQKKEREMRAVFNGPS